MGAELSTHDESSFEQTSTQSRNSTASASHRETHKKSRALFELVRSLEIRSEFYEQKTAAAAAAAADSNDDVKDSNAEEEKTDSNCYVSAGSLPCVH
jgi:hypothetical protein